MEKKMIETDKETIKEKGEDAAMTEEGSAGAGEDIMGAGEDAEIGLGENEKAKAGTKKKKRQNRYKGILWDYYMTNRQITKMYDEAYKKQPKNAKWTKTEKIYLALIIIGVICAIFRFLIF